MGKSEINETMRPSQLIYHNGPGAIVDLLDRSVMVMAADTWRIPFQSSIKDERVLQALNKEEIKLLNEYPDKVEVTVTPFPKWKICPKCQMMTNYTDKNHCHYCEQNGEIIPLYPSRFVISCAKGHVSDFPYVEWVHQNKSCTADQPVLKLLKKGDSGSLSDLSVTCVKCQATMSLANILTKDALKDIVPVCTGEQYWLQQTEPCGEEVKTYLRGASNIYSPSIVSFLQIPLSEEHRDPLMKKVLNHKSTLDSVKENDDKFTTLLSVLEFDSEDKERILHILNVAHDESLSYQSIRKQEWNTLVKKDINDLSESGYKSKSVSIHQKMRRYFSAIHRVDAVPQLQVHRGFKRIEYVDRFEIEGSEKLLPIMKNKQNNWLPGIKNIGEGIFFQFNRSTILNWQNKHHPDDISKIIMEHFNAQREKLGYNNIPFDSKYVMMHTFSHALIKELANHSGYATTALKERIYCDDQMEGVLIYTASGDSEGTLGGLIEQSSEDKLYPIFIRALERMMHCSSDPHCSEGEFMYQSTANGAACHACGFVSETSCDMGNQLLDRRLLININPNEKYGFFDLNE